MNRAEKLKLLHDIKDGRKKITVLRTPRLKQCIGLDDQGLTQVKYFIDDKSVDNGQFSAAMDRYKSTSPLKIKIIK